VTIPAADGYHFGDSHAWSKTDQANLVTELRQAKPPRRRSIRSNDN